MVTKCKICSSPTCNAWALYRFIKPDALNRTQNAMAADTGASIVESHFSFPFFVEFFFFNALEKAIRYRMRTGLISIRGVKCYPAAIVTIANAQPVHMVFEVRIFIIIEYLDNAF